MEEIKGMILSLTPYKDNRIIIKILSENLIYNVSTKEKIAKKENITRFSNGIFKIYKGPLKYYQLSNFKCEFYIKNSYFDLKRLILLDFLTELLNIIDLDSDLNFEYLTKVPLKVQMFDNLNNNPYYHTLDIFHDILSSLGINPDNDIDYLKTKQKVSLNDQITKEEFIKIFSIWSDILNNSLDIYLTSKKNIIERL